jgi:hypothetical protein
MRYVAKINIHAPGILDLLHSGALKLQPGQWVECGTGSRLHGHYPSRFSHVTEGGRVIVCYHGPDAAKKYLAVAAANKTAQAFLDACRATREAEREAAEKTAKLIKARIIRDRLSAEYFAPLKTTARWAEGA